MGFRLFQGNTTLFEKKDFSDVSLVYLHAKHFLQRHGRSDVKNTSNVFVVEQKSDGLQNSLVDT